MIKLGITGGIGSGKSTVATLFELHGIPVYNADKEAQNLNNTSAEIREKLTRHFGHELYEENILNKKMFAEIIFNDPDKLTLANSIIHPEVLKNFNNWCFQNAHYSIVALEAAILFESKFHLYLDEVISVYAPLNLRIARVAKRDKVDEDSVKSRIDNQMAEKEKIKLAQYVVVNDSESSLIEQVQNMIDEIIHNTL